MNGAAHPSPGVPISVTLEAMGVNTRLTVADAAGKTIASGLLHSADAGALGGQLISASHRPLQRSYTLTLAEDAPTSTEATKSTATASPALLAERPRPERVETPIWSSSRPAVDEDEPWRFTKSADEHLSKHKLTRDQVVEILDDPETITPAEHGGGTTYKRKGIGAVVPADEPRLVIAVFRDGSGTSDRPRGGVGRRKASTFNELRQMLEDHDFTVSLSGTHPRVQHPTHPAFITLPGTPSDARSFDNAIAEIRRRTGIDITRARSKS